MFWFFFSLRWGMLHGQWPGPCGPDQSVGGAGEGRSLHFLGFTIDWPLIGGDWPMKPKNGEANHHWFFLVMIGAQTCPEFNSLVTGEKSSGTCQGLGLYPLTVTSRDSLFCHIYKFLSPWCTRIQRLPFGRNKTLKPQTISASKLGQWAQRWKTRSGIWLTK